MRNRVSEPAILPIARNSRGRPTPAVALAGGAAVHSLRDVLETLYEACSRARAVRPPPRPGGQLSVAAPHAPAAQDLFAYQTIKIVKTTDWRLSGASPQRSAPRACRRRP